jgi:hypothetical protein
MMWPFNRFSRMMLTLQHPRSNQWPTVRKLWLKDHPTCAACGSVKSLQVHHKFPFHLDPSKELDPSNFITLCERIFTDHHLEIGHLGNFKNYNVNVEADAAKNLARLNLKATWHLKEPQATLPYVAEGKGWRVVRDFTAINGEGKEITVKAGFYSDGYTGVWQPGDPLPAIVHDWIYEQCRTWDDGTPITKFDADNMLRWLMSQSASWTTRRLATLYWLGVTFFGSKYWDAKVTFKASFKAAFRRQ